MQQLVVLFLVGAGAVVCPCTSCAGSYAYSHGAQICTAMSDPTSPVDPARKATRGVSRKVHVDRYVIGSIQPASGTLETTQTDGARWQLDNSRIGSV